MSIWFLIGIAIFLFAVLTFFRRWHDYSVLFAIAIGFAVNANIYNSSTNPVYLGEIVFAIDSILYMGFTFTVLICAKDHGIKQAVVLTTSTVIAIIVSAGIELFAELSSNGYKQEFLNTFFAYLFSALGTAIGIALMLYIFYLLNKRKTNVYLTFIICAIIANIINSSIYYGFSLIVNGSQSNFGYVLLGSLIGKTFSMALGLISYFINSKYWIPLDLKNKNIDLELNNNEETIEKNDEC